METQEPSLAGRTKVVGHVTVDSGGLIVTDPCRLSEWRSGYQDRPGRRYRDRSNGEIYVSGEDFICFGADELPNGKIMEQMVEDGEVELLRDDQESDFSYEGYWRARGCAERAGQLHQRMIDFRGLSDVLPTAAVVFGTEHGGGTYPVYITYGKRGRPVSVTIDLG